MICCQCKRTFRASAQEEWAKVTVQLEPDDGEKLHEVTVARGYYCGRCIPEQLRKDHDEYEGSVIA